MSDYKQGKQNSIEISLITIRLNCYLCKNLDFTTNLFIEPSLVNRVYQSHLYFKFTLPVLKIAISSLTSKNRYSVGSKHV